jgi:hypothetical protein
MIALSGFFSAINIVLTCSLSVEDLKVMVLWCGPMFEVKAPGVLKIMVN